MRSNMISQNYTASSFETHQRVSLCKVVGRARITGSEVSILTDPWGTVVFMDLAEAAYDNAGEGG